MNIDPLALFFSCVLIWMLYHCLKAFFIELILPIINYFNSAWVFNVRVNLAQKNNSYFRHQGFTVMAKMFNYPMARVQYSDGKCSLNMPIGNAVDYAEIFDGKVLRPV